MKTSYLFILFAILGLVVGTQSSFSNSQPMKGKDGTGFAVLELFTSEGCSSCPPADELLAKIQKEMVGKPVYLLAYHVDYWDRLGWKDVYSSADFSNRQAQYGRWLDVLPIYTPQLVVNGKTQFVGSDASDIRRTVSEQLTTKTDAILTIQSHQEGERLSLRYQATHIAKGSHLLLAVIQKAAQSKVLRGENAGHMLSHIQIVRKLQSEPLIAAEGSAVILLPKEYNAQNWEVMGFVQDQSSGEILAVAKVIL